MALTQSNERALAMASKKKYYFSAFLQLQRQIGGATKTQSAVACLCVPAKWEWRKTWLRSCHDGFLVLTTHLQIKRNDQKQFIGFCTRTICMHFVQFMCKYKCARCAISTAPVRHSLTHTHTPIVRHIFWIPARLKISLEPKTLKSTELKQSK